MLQRSNAERQIWKTNFLFRFVKRSDTVGEVGRPGPSPAQMWDKGPESWVRAGLPGLASHEQIANTDFANSVRSFDKTLGLLGSVFPSAASCTQCWRGRG